MQSRRRVQDVLAHRVPDKVPVDFGSTAVSGIHVSCVEQLRDYYGLEKRPVKVHEPYQMLGWIEDDLLDALGIDTVCIPAYKTMFGFPNENWKEFRLPWGQTALVSEHFRTAHDTGGDLLIYPEGDTSAPPSGRMAHDAFFFDTIIRQPPVREEELDPKDNLEEFGPISREELDHITRHAREASQSGRAVVGYIGGAALGDIALVTGPFLKHPRGIRDVAEWYVSTLIRQDYIHAVFSRQTELAIQNLAKLKDAVGDSMDVIFTCGTDFGTQTSSFCSPETFDALYAPYYRKINAWIHKHTPWKVFKHSCGAVEMFLSRFAEVGFDIFNPVQCSAADMNPFLLKRDYGRDLVFWGGGVDTQKTLPFGTPEQVREEVLERCSVFAEEGGFVFNAIHNLQAKTPVCNIAAMFEAVKEFNGER